MGTCVCVMRAHVRVSVCACGMQNAAGCTHSAFALAPHLSAKTMRLIATPSAAYQHAHTHYTESGIFARNCSASSRLSACALNGHAGLVRQAGFFVWLHCQKMHNSCHMLAVFCDSCIRSSFVADIVHNLRPSQRKRGKRRLE